MQYDLEERTARFEKEVIEFTKRISVSVITRPLITQLVRSATSIGANYCEADDAESKRDFIHKIAICKKEARETKHWLKMVYVAEPELLNPAMDLWSEARQLNLIFNSIIRSCKKE